MTTAFIGQPVSRVDGRQKVTGRATYAAEFDQAGQAHGVKLRKLDACNAARRRNARPASSPC